MRRKKPMMHECLRQMEPLKITRLVTSALPFVPKPVECPNARPEQQKDWRPDHDDRVAVESKDPSTAIGTRKPEQFAWPNGAEDVYSHDKPKHTTRRIVDARGYIR